MEAKAVSHTECIKSDFWCILVKKCMISDYMLYKGIASYTVHMFKRKLLNCIQEELSLGVVNKTFIIWFELLSVIVRDHFVSVSIFFCKDFL